MLTAFLCCALALAPAQALEHRAQQLERVLRLYVLPPAPGPDVRQVVQEYSSLETRAERDRALRHLKLQLQSVELPGEVEPFIQELLEEMRRSGTP